MLVLLAIKNGISKSKMVVIITQFVAKISIYQAKIQPLCGSSAQQNKTIKVNLHSIRFSYVLVRFLSVFASP